MHSHKPKLKQVNKPFKGSTKNKAKKSGSERVLSRTNEKQGKHARLLAAKHLRAKKFQESRIKHLAGSSSPDHVAPKVVMILSFSRDVDPTAFKRALSSFGEPGTFVHSQESSEPVIPPLGQGVTFQLPAWSQTAGTSKAKQYVTLIDASPYAHAFSRSASEGIENLNGSDATIVPTDMECEALQFVLDVAKTANVLLCLLPGGECSVTHPPFDPWGYEMLSALRLQGLPTPVGVMVGTPAYGELSAAKKKDQRKLVGRFFFSEMGDDKKFLTAEEPEDFRRVLRVISSTCPKEFNWRGHTRGFMVTDKAYLLRGVDTVGTRSTLVVEGFARGVGFTVKHPIHITGIGDVILERITSFLPPGLQKRSATTESRETLLQELTPEIEAELEEAWAPLRPFNPLDGDQTWPTEKELEDAECAAKRVASTRSQRITVPRNEFEEAWLEALGDDNLEDGETEEPETSELHGADQPMAGDQAVMDEKEDEMQEEEDAEGDAFLQHDMVDVETETPENMVNQKQRHNFELQERGLEDMQFPDEVDTPTEGFAKDRFARYRGLKSFRSSPWDPYEELPSEYSRVFEFDSFNATLRYAKHQFRRDCQLLEDGSTATGRYLRLYMRLSESDPVEQAKTEALARRLERLDCNKKGEERTPTAPLIVSTLLPFERKVTVCHMELHRRSEYRETIPSKTLVEVQCGFKRFLARPIYSELPQASSSGTRGTTKTRFLRFFHPDTSAVASIYAPTQFPPAPVLIFRTSAAAPDGTQDEARGMSQSSSVSASGTHLIAWGYMAPPDPLRVMVKRIVLTGYPFRVHKRKAVVRFMFFNPVDIRWFMPVELCTKKGLRGHIKESLGTHGYMKCLFNDRVDQSDTICLYLYKRAYPKWFPPTWEGIGSH